MAAVRPCYTRDMYIRNRIFVECVRVAMGLPPLFNSLKNITHEQRLALSRLAMSEMQNLQRGGKRKARNVPKLRGTTPW